MFFRVHLSFTFAALLAVPVLAEDGGPPRIVLIGDSTVKNGAGRGDGGMWGWGQAFAEHIRPGVAEVENRALGGRSSRTYLTEGLWERSRERLREGDFVLMQFGHNDGGQLFEGDRPRASLKGNGDESQDGVVAATGNAETVYTYGWYLRKYITDAQAKGATAIVLSPVPRNMWREDKVLRASRDYGLWAKQAAEQTGALFVDLNEIIAAEYERFGEEAVSRDLFTVADHTHTTEAGARINAACAARGLRQLVESPVAKLIAEETPAQQNGDAVPAGEAKSPPRSAFRFLFQVRGVHDGGIHVDGSPLYSDDRGYGFEQIDPAEATRGSQSQYFSVRLPEGNYRVAMRFARGSDPTAIKAELRRLVIARGLKAPPRQEFTVNVRQPAISGAGEQRVSLKPREKTSEAWAWDDRLTLEFCDGQLPIELTILPNPRAATIYLLGDSTVADQPVEPWGSWGQLFPMLVRPDVAVANHSESGESVRSSVGARRFAKVMSLLRRGDVVMIQFGHNDMKDRRPDALAEYRRQLAKAIEDVRARGATPVLVTSMERKSGIAAETLGAFPQTMRDLAKQTGTALVDLQALSRQLYAALGADLDAAFQDGTHHTTYGAYLLARCVAQGLQEAAPEVAKLLSAELPPFDPQSPPAAKEFRVPPSGRWSPNTPQPAAKAAAARTTLSFDADWRFVENDRAGLEADDVDDGAWERVDVPHDWSIAGPFAKDNPAGGDGGFLPTGVAWYRKHFSAPSDWQGKRVFVEFDGVTAHNDVWLNGKHLGRRPNGYVSFRYELTPHLRPGADAANVLAVRTDTSQQVASRWYAGSGIYRHVRLQVVDPLHLSADGVFVTTPVATAANAEVHVSAEIDNQREAAANFTLNVRLLDPAGKFAGEAMAAGSAQPSAGSTAECAIALDAPRLWGLNSPAVYRAVATLSDADTGVVVDEVAVPFGIRTAEFRSDTGFWLNGENIKVKGVCLHHDGGAFGAAVPLSIWRDRLIRLRLLGVNAVRTAHNPVAPEFLHLCDRLGMLVMDEFFDCWTVGKRRHDYHHDFREWAHRDMRDTIRRDRNHPSIILYSVGNEIHDTPKQELAKEILRGLVDECHATDPTRPVTQALFRPNVSHDYDNGLADMLDVIGTNYRDLELLQAWRDKPGRKIIGTEQTHDRGIWLACRDNPQHAGQFLWVGIDYLGESRRWPVTTFNAGLLDRTGRIHPRGFERLSWWGTLPMVHAFRREAATEASPTDPGYEAVEWQRRQVLFDDWTPRDLAPHRELVEVYSNCDEVELSLNGRSLGVKPKPTDARPRTWDVEFAPGELVATGRNAGREVDGYSLRTAGKAARLSVAADRDKLPPAWDEVAIVEVALVDEADTPLPRGEGTVEFTIHGPGVVAAVDNGSIVSHEPFHASRCKLFQGQCTAYVRATGSDGDITLTASLDGVEAGTAVIHSTP